MVENSTELVSPLLEKETQERLADNKQEFLNLLEGYKSGTITEDDFATTMAARMTASKAREERANENALTDGMTGLWNRKGFDKLYRQTVNRLKRSRMSDHPEYAVVIYVDLNGLKETNDNEGHEAGDDMIRKFARLFKEYSRSTDDLAITARPGGDEFTGILTNTDQNSLGKWWERFSPALEAEGLRASVGSCDIDPNDPETSLKSADKAMYEAKNLKHDGKSHYIQTQQSGVFKPVVTNPTLK